MFDKNGKLLRKQSVYYFDKKTVSGVRFDKYHITDSNGRISKGERGFVNVAEQKVRGKKIIAGIYYVEAYGKLADRGTVRYIRQRRFGGVILKVVIIISMEPEESACVRLFIK